MQRHISLDVYDFTGHSLCNLYDSISDISGQATDVVISTQRNGFKEIKFSIPSTCFTEDGETKNYRLDYLINDYRLRFYDKDAQYVDWFIISEAKVTHNEFSMQHDVRASHISQLLNTKNLNLEFSDDEGNNTGTIGQIAETILEGTGWHINEVHFFEEEEKFNKGKVEKVRSFTAPAKTGAFKMMSDLCEMFDAKPIYHGEGTYVEDGVVKKGRTVDIVPINPFSEKFEQGSVPPDLNENKIIELYYDKNITNITRTLDTDSLVTVFYAYGSYGDRNGMASLQKAQHAEITFASLTEGDYQFAWKDAWYYFSIDRTVTDMKWSSIDFTSRSYIYNGTDFFNVWKEPEEDVTYSKINITSNMVEYVDNKVTNLLDFTYYQKIGMLTNEHLLEIAKAQRELPELHAAAEEAAETLAEAKAKLAETATGDGFLKFHIKSSDKKNGYLRLKLNKDVYPDGVIYRSDYDEAKRNYFTWTPARGFKDNGDAINGIGSVVYIIRHENETNRTFTSWTKAYVRAIGNDTDNYYRDDSGNLYTLHTEQHYDRKDYDGIGTHFPDTGAANIIYVADDTKKLYVWEDAKYKEIYASPYYYGLNEFPEPTTITLWTSNTWYNDREVYMFSSDSIAGLFGPREDEIASNKKSIEKAVKADSETHSVYFGKYSDAFPPIDENGYCWYYANDQYNMNQTGGRYYFCYSKNGELDWSQVEMYTSTTNPETLGYRGNYNYLYSLRNFMLYHWETDSYKPFNRNTEEKTITSDFAAVVEGCNKHERLSRGLFEIYKYSDSNTDMIPKGTNIAFKDEYNNYCLFTTTVDITNPQDIYYTPGDKILWQDTDENHILKGMERHRRYLEFPKTNELSPFTLRGKYDRTNHTISYEGNSYISNNISVKPRVRYNFNLPGGYTIVCFDTNHRFVEEFTSANVPGAYFITPNHVTQIQIVTSIQITGSHYLGIHNATNVLFSKDIMYNIRSFSGSGEKYGLYYLMEEFMRLSDYAYLNALPALQQAQTAITDRTKELASLLGDMYREGYWQQNDYSEGDEDKLYADALDNLKEISHPLATYEVSYLDLYESEEPNNETIVSLPYPDIDINYAAHLMDDDIGTNQWAYVDSIDKCYDKPWNTRIEINTRLSMIGQQSFTDVMAKIAEVANETKAKQTIYSKAAALGGAGQYAAEKLEGMIKANKLYILGGTSNWYTDPKGNIVFEDTDGNSAMMLTGRGLMISNSKDIYGDWEWRTALSGQGFNCDVIATGEFSAKHIIAGTITADKLSSDVGQELEIGSNKALLFYATVDGQRPVDGLKTTDAVIEIRAGDPTADPPTDAKIDILSGGKLNLRGATLDIKSTSASPGSFILESGSTMDINAKGSINIGSGAEINVNSNGKFLINSTNFKILEDPDNPNKTNVTVTGEINTTGGRIAGYRIGQVTEPRTIDFMYAGGTNSLTSTSPGVYIGTDGINIGGGKFIFKSDGTGSLKISAGNIELTNDGNLDDILNNIGERITGVSEDLEEVDNSVVIETVRVYRRGESDTEPPALSSWCSTTEWTASQDGYWEEVPPNPGSVLKYIWSRNRYKNRQNKYLYGAAKYEPNLSKKTILKTTKQYMRTETTDVPAADASGWDYKVPKPIKNNAGVELNPYVWSCQFVYYSDLTSERMYITREQGLEYMSAAGITATNIAAGITPVPKVESTGIKIENNSVTVQATSSLNFAGNASINILNYAGQNGIILNKDGISIGSGGNIGIIAGGVVEIGSAGNAFEIGATSNRAYIRNGVTNLWDSEHDGVYIGTNGIQVGKNKFMVQADGKLSCTYGKIAGWTIESNRLHKEVYAAGSDTIYTRGVGFSTDGGVAIYAGLTSEMAYRSDAPFYVNHEGALKATNATVKGNIRAKTLYIGATDDSNGTLLRLDDNGLVMQATGDAGGIVRKTAGIKINNGVVISSESTDAKTAICNAARIKVDAETGIVLMANSTTADGYNKCIKKLSMKDNYIDINVTNVGYSASTTTESGIVIWPTYIKIRTGGNLSILAGGTLDMRAGTIYFSAEQKADITAGTFKVPTGMTITTAGIKMTGSQYLTMQSNGYIRLGTTNDSTYVKIDSSGVVMKGTKVVFIDASTGEQYYAWGREDIMILPKGKSRTWAENKHANFKRDWVLIEPGYNASVSFSGSYNGKVPNDTGRNFALTRANTDYLTDVSDWFKYTITITCVDTQGTQGCDAYFNIYATNGSETRNLTPPTAYVNSTNSRTDAAWHLSYSAHGTTSGATTTYNLTLSYSGIAANNLAAQGFWIGVSGLRCVSYNGHQYTVTFSVQVQSSATTARAPCSVYYYPYNG